MTVTLEETAPMPSLEKPGIPADHPEGMRVVRTRAVAADGQHRWALAVRLTPRNIADVADRSGLRIFATVEGTTGKRSQCLREGDISVTFGDWLLVVGTAWVPFQGRDMNRSFTSVRGGVLSGR